MLSIVTTYHVKVAITLSNLVLIMERQTRSYILWLKEFEKRESALMKNDEGQVQRGLEFTLN